MAAEPGAGEEEAARLHQVGGAGQQSRAFAHGVAHQAEVEGLEVAQPAVEELGGICAGALPEIARLEDGAAQALEGGLAGQGRAIDSAAYDDEVVTQSIIPILL